MSAGLARYPVGLALPALAGAAAAAAFAGYPQTRYAAAALVCVIVAGSLTVWPWAALPVVVLGGELASQVLGLSRVTPVVAVHVALVALGFLAVVLRRGLDQRWGRRVATPADAPMVALAAAIALGAAYGLARGNPPHAVLVAAYELAVVPAYFFLATLTLSSHRRLRAAGILYAAAAGAMALAGFAAPGRHGGLFSVLALLPLLVAAGRAGTTRRWLLLAAIALFEIDVVFAAYRAVWIAAGIALVLLLLTGNFRVRKAAAASAILAVLVASVATATGTGFRSRTELAATQLHRSTGYRLPEASIGLHTFLANPLIGQGLGQVKPDVFVADLGIADVGPVYHIFYVTLLANGGLLGLALVLWPLSTALRRGRSPRRSQALAFRALLVGFMGAAAFAGPTDGHWELGLLPALTLIAVRLEEREARP